MNVYYFYLALLLHIRINDNVMLVQKIQATNL